MLGSILCCLIFLPSHQTHNSKSLLSAGKDALCKRYKIGVDCQDGRTYVILLFKVLLLHWSLDVFEGITIYYCCASLCPFIFFKFYEPFIFFNILWVLVIWSNSIAFFVFVLISNFFYFIIFLNFIHFFPSLTLI